MLRFFYVNSLNNELSVLKNDFYAMLVDENVGFSKSNAVVHTKLAEAVLANDSKIDDMEVKVEEECLKILALHQPVAIDLRFIVSVHKLNSDLERLCDLSTNIAKSAITLSSLPKLDIPLNFSLMGERVKALLKKALSSLIYMNHNMSREVMNDDAEIDDILRLTKQLILKALKENPTYAESLLAIYSAFRRLERIADHATNIAEDVIYTLTGEIVRHQTHEF